MRKCMISILLNTKIRPETRSFILCNYAYNPWEQPNLPLMIASAMPRMTNMAMILQICRAFIFVLLSWLPLRLVILIESNELSTTEARTGVLNFFSHTILSHTNTKFLQSTYISPSGL